MIMQIKNITIGLICMLCSGALYADYDADDLQKMFTDKRQRAQIDAARSGNYTGNELQKQTSKVNVSGYMTRSDGKSVVWVNDKNTLESSRVGDVRVHKSTIGKNKKVTVSVEDKTTRLKPGETWYKETGKVVDSQ